MHSAYIFYSVTNPPSFNSGPVLHMECILGTETHKILENGPVFIALQNGIIFSKSS